MKRLVEQAGDRVARGLRRVWDNALVLWLGSMLGAWSDRLNVVWQCLASVLLLAAGAGFVRWWELRRLKRDFLTAMEAGGRGLMALPTSWEGEQR